jgi:hypothetical protein
MWTTDELLTFEKLLAAALDHPDFCASLVNKGVQGGIDDHRINLVNPQDAEKLQKFFDTPLSAFAGKAVKDMVFSLSDMTGTITRGTVYDKPRVWDV